MLNDSRRAIVKARARTAMLAINIGLLALALAGCGASTNPRRALVTNPSLDPGSPLSGRMAPDFRLTDQFGRRISLRQYRGRVVMLAFNDSECTTICPLTTTAMQEAKRALGPAASRVQLLGIDANPGATSVHSVLSYSELHGLLHQWHFLTGSVRKLKAVWAAYGIGVEIQRGQIDHTPALFMIDPQGRMRRVYLTQQSYAAVPQLGQLLAQEAARLLADHPKVNSRLTYAALKGIGPAAPVTLPRAGGGTVHLGSGTGPHLLVFFATWDREVIDLGAKLDALRRYAAGSAGAHLPPLVAVDEASVEPSPSAATRFLAGLHRPLRYPVALDRTGRVGDGYEVQDEPWFVLVSGSGRILWYRDAATAGWPSPGSLATEVKAALAKAPQTPGGAAAEQALAGSPSPLAALHRQGSRLLGDQKAMNARLRALRGYPIVVNVWASWCGPCRQEFGLLASASLRYGKKVAFLGADYNDQGGDARAFLSGHRVSYPSYATSNGSLQSLLPAGVAGTPTTFFINRAGKVVDYVHTGQYQSQGSLDQDIQTYALGG